MTIFTDWNAQCNLTKKGWSRDSIIFRSLNTCLSFPSPIRKLFYMLFIANKRPESFLRTKKTLENPPFPMTLRSWKSLVHTCLLLLGIISKTYYRKNSYLKSELPICTYSEFFPFFCHKELTKNRHFRFILSSLVQLLFSSLS